MNVCESVTTEDVFKMLLWAGYAPVSGAPPSYRPPVAPPPSSNGPTQYYSNNGPSQSQYSTSNGAPQVSALLLTSTPHFPLTWFASWLREDVILRNGSICTTKVGTYLSAGPLQFLSGYVIWRHPL